MNFVNKFTSKLNLKIKISRDGFVMILCGLLKELVGIFELFRLFFTSPFID